jgi:uncharacterized membrane protein
MFEFLFKYPLLAYRKGTVVLVSGWPVWLLALLVVVAAGGIGFAIWRRGGRTRERALKAAVLWGLQTALVALLLVMVWRPALSVSMLAPRQNVVAVVLDDSRSMDVSEDGATRRARMLEMLDGGLLRDLERRFQVRLFRIDGTTERVASLDKLPEGAAATRLGPALEHLLDGFSTLPLGAVLLMSDGADNAGGPTLEEMNAIRSHRVPVHTIGFGNTQITHDVELSNLELPAQALKGSRLEALVSVRQQGFAGRAVKLVLKRGGEVAASREIVLGPDGQTQTERILFNAGDAGLEAIEAEVTPVEGEANAANNAMRRVMPVDGTPRRILYVEGEPRWEYKFMRRAVEDDSMIQIASMLRTTQNKIYRQGIENSQELADGFPAKVDDLFRYQGLILGSIEAGYFTSEQRELIRQFVDRRGGGLLFTAGRFALADGGYEAPPFPELLPVNLPHQAGTFRRDPAYAYLTPAGRDGLICRIEDDPQKNVERWKRLPYLANFQDVGTPKPGAVVLASMKADNMTLPLLVTEQYGRGRTAVFATAGSWRWQMLQPVSDMSHEIFWRQFLRWLVAGTPGRVAATAPAVVNDRSEVELRAEVKDETYLPATDAKVEAHVSGEGTDLPVVEMHPEASQAGVYEATLSVPKAGAYAAEVVAREANGELGRAVVAFRREDGVAENFHQEQNRDLLKKLASETGGRYWEPGDARRLVEEMELSNAGIQMRQMRELWDMPALFLLAVGLKAAEWVLRRRWGFV